MNPWIGTGEPSVTRAGEPSPSRHRALPRAAWIALAGAIGLVACRSRAPRPDVPEPRAFSASMPQAAVSIRSDRGSEQGVDTEVGILFLGRTVRSGPVDVTFYVNGASFTYPGTVQSGEGTIALVSTPFVAQLVALADAPVQPGEIARVAGVKGGTIWEHPVMATQDPALYGNILDVAPVEGIPPLTLEQLSGAGIYVWREERWRLAGIATEVIEWRGPTSGSTLSNESPRAFGSTRMMLLYAGPRELGMAATLPREYFERPKRVYDPRLVR